MKNKKLSIVVPNYNNEKYLKKCIDSLIHQSYQNLEIIVVEDGSKDGMGWVMLVKSSQGRQVM